MQIDHLNHLFDTYKESSLFGRYIHTDSIAPLLEKRSLKKYVSQIGTSVNAISIYDITIGSGPKHILFWSQMHGNESTTTKACFDLLNTLLASDQISEQILKQCTIKIIPILNPDGAKAYTRLNANGIDLNRDAQHLSQPESKVLRQVFDTFKPQFCFNLHGQRTIFSAGNINKPATVSFLAPAQDEACTVTETRKVAMELISVLNRNLQLQIKDQIGIYDDAFNLNCVGDTFQSLNVPTILFEAGHFQNDYHREVTRKFIYQSLVLALHTIATHDIDGSNYEAYFDIPENKKLFFDILIRNTSEGDMAIQYVEKCIDDQIAFVPTIEKIGDLSSYFGHIEYEANGFKVFDSKKVPVQEHNEIDFVCINNEKFSLKLKKN